MQNTVDLLYSRKSGEATGDWIFAFWKNFDTCFPDILDTDVQARMSAWMLAKLEWEWQRDEWVQPDEYGKNRYSDSRYGLEDSENIRLSHFLVLSYVKVNCSEIPGIKHRIARGSVHWKGWEQLLPCQCGGDISNAAEYRWTTLIINLKRGPEYKPSFPFTSSALNQTLGSLAHNEENNEMKFFYWFQWRWKPAQCVSLCNQAKNHFPQHYMLCAVQAFSESTVFPLNRILAITSIEITSNRNQQ